MKEGTIMPPARRRPPKEQQTSETAEATADQADQPGTDEQPGVSDAEAAVGEVENTDIAVTFRGEQFKIPRARLSGARFSMAQRIMAQTGIQKLTNQQVADVAWALCGEVDSSRFISLCGEEEPLLVPLSEIIEAVNAASGVGNS